MLIVDDWLEDFVELRMTSFELRERFIEVGVPIVRVEDFASRLAGVRTFLAVKKAEANSSVDKFSYANAAGETITSSVELSLPAMLLKAEGREEALLWQDLPIPLPGLRSETVVTLSTDLAEGMSAADALGLHYFIYHTDDSVEMSYLELGRMLSLQNGLPYLAPEPVVLGEEITLSAQQLAEVKRLMKENSADMLLLLRADKPLVPVWMAKRLYLSEHGWHDFSDAATLYVNQELGTSLKVFNADTAYLTDLSGFLVYYGGGRNEVDLRGLNRIRQLWEQSARTVGTIIEV